MKNRLSIIFLISLLVLCSLSASPLTQAAALDKATAGDTLAAKGNGVMTLQLQNGTRGQYSDSQIYWCILGYNPANHKLSYVDQNGNLVPAAVADNDAPNHLTKNGQNYANYFYTLSRKNWVSLPQIDGARLFLSVGSPMYIKINTNNLGAVGFAGPNMANPSDPNKNVYFEWIEFTIDRLGYHGNTTRVDQFCFPLTMRLTGTDGYDKTIGETATRTALFNAYKNEVPAEFKTLVDSYRIMAPCKTTFGQGRQYAHYFDSYIDEVWNYYKSHELKFKCDAGSYSGHVSGNDFVFSKNNGPYNLYIHGKPTSQEVFEGSGKLAAGNAEEKVVQAQLCAAFNRHVVKDPANWSNASRFYTAGPANFYAKFWHDHSLGGLAYGFCYDDVRNFSSLLENAHPKTVVVTIGW